MGRDVTFLGGGWRGTYLSGGSGTQGPLQPLHLMAIGTQGPQQPTIEIPTPPAQRQRLPATSGFQLLPLGADRRDRAFGRPTRRYGGTSLLFPETLVCRTLSPEGPRGECAMRFDLEHLIYSCINDCGG